MVWNNVFSKILPWRKGIDAAEAAKIARIRTALANVEPYTGSDVRSHAAYIAKIQRDMLELLQREQLQPASLMAILTGLEAVSEEDTREQLRASKSITLNDIKRLKDLTPQQLRSITLLTARWLSSERERVRMHHIDYVKGMAELQGGGFTEEEFVHIYMLLLRFFWSANDRELKRLREQNPLFTAAGPAAESIQRFLKNDNPEGMLEFISAINASYPTDEATRVAAANGLYSWVIKSIETVFSTILREEFSIEKMTRKAVRKTSARAASFALLAMLFGTGVFGKFELMRKTSQQLIEERAKMTVDEMKKRVEMMDAVTFPGLTPEQFEKNKRELLQAMDDEAKKATAKPSSIVVTKDASDVDIINELRKQFTPSTVSAAKNVATGAFDKLTGILRSALDKEDKWHQYNREQLTQLRQRLQTDLDTLFQQKDFIRAVKKDIKRGVITVEYADGRMEKLARQAKNAVTDGAKGVTTTVIGTTLRQMVGVINDTFKALLGVFWGSVTGNQEMKESSKNYLMILGGVLAALGVLGVFLAVWFGGALYGVVRVAKLGLKWTCKAGQLAYRLLLEGLPGDVGIILGKTSIFDLVTFNNQEQRTRFEQVLGQTTDLEKLHDTSVDIS